MGSLKEKEAEQDPNTGTVKDPSEAIDAAVDTLIQDKVNSISSVIALAVRKSKETTLLAERSIAAAERKVYSLNEKNQLLEEQCISLEKRLLDADGGNSQLREELDNLRNQIETANEERKSLAAQLVVVQSNLEAQELFAQRRAAEAAAAETRAVALEQEITLLSTWKQDAIIRLEKNTVSSLEALRQNSMNSFAEKEKEMKLQFLEQERNKLVGEISAMKSAYDSLSIESKVKIQSYAEEVQDLRSRVAVGDTKIHSSNLLIADLKDQVQTLTQTIQETEETNKAQIENLIQMNNTYKESIEDAQARIKELETTLKNFRPALESNQVVTAKDSKSGRPSAKQKVSNIASLVDYSKQVDSDVILEIVQKELQERAEEMENQAIEYQRALQNESRLAVLVQSLNRENENLRSEVSHNEKQLADINQKAHRLTEENSLLQRKVMLFTSPQTGNITPFSTREPKPRSVFQTPKTPGTFTLTGSEFESAQKRQEELVAAIVAQRDLYRNMLLKDY